MLRGNQSTVPGTELDIAIEAACPEISVAHNRAVDSRRGAYTLYMLLPQNALNLQPFPGYINIQPNCPQGKRIKKVSNKVTVNVAGRCSRQRIPTMSGLSLSVFRDRRYSHTQFLQAICCCFGTPRNWLQKRRIWRHRFCRAAQGAPVCACHACQA